MRTIPAILLAVMTYISANACEYTYSFNNTPISEAIVRISKDHPDINISFIYKELDNYKTSARIHTDDAYVALRRTIGINPISIIKKDHQFYIEALQHGRFCYTGRAIDTDNEPVIAATVMLLAPKDSTVITYGITDDTGCFSIPCDRQSVIAKLTCIGFKPTYKEANSFTLGNIKMSELPIRLKTVSVEADYASAYSDKTVYRPTQRQKNASANATDLLLQMSIPQVDVNPVTKTIKLPGGENIAVFIDCIEATQQGLATMLTKDVKRVEFMAFPKDPRFKGASYVLNFVMQKYEWGGYTRLEADQWFSVNRTEGNIYSKFAYKNMTFDIYADEILFSNRHGGVDMTEQFKFTDLYGNGSKDIQRHTYTDKYLYRANSNDITFRAIYNTESTQFANSLNFALNNTPHEDEEEHVSYSAQSLNTENTTRIKSSKDYAINYNGDYYRYFSEAVSLSADASFIYGHNTLNSDYKGNNNIHIVNNAVENTYCATIAPRLEWALSEVHSLSFSGDGRYQHHAIDYLGSSPSCQLYKTIIGMGGVGYDFLSKKVRVGSTISWAWESNNIAGLKVSNSFPVFEFHGVFTPTNKHQLQAQLNLGREVPEAVNKSPNVLQHDILMWYTGSPDLKDNSTLMTRLNYTWLPGNQWQLGVNGQYYQSNDRVSAVYHPNGPNGTMLQKYMNSGNFHCGMIGLTATARLFGGKLALMARPQLWLRKSTGVYDLRNRDVVFQATATYYWGNFNLFAYYCTPNKYIEEESGYLERTSSRYMLSLGWHKGPWHTNFTAYNFFHTSWKAGRMTLNSQYYGYQRQEFNTNLHQRFSISVSYTFNYGKKVDTNNEAMGSGTAGSAILK